MREGLIAAALLFAPFAQSQTIIFVDDDAAPGGDGSSWDTAFRHLQDALDPGIDGPRAPVEIRVAQGVYFPDLSESDPTLLGARTATFRLEENMLVLGGFAGLTGDDPDARAPSDFLTILSGDLAQNDDAGIPTALDDNAYHVLETWFTTAVLLEGVVVSGGRANRPFEDGWWPARRDDSGGGMLLVDSDAVVRDCLFTENQGDANASVWVALEGPFAFVEAGAGAVLVAGGAPVFENTDFVRNRANRIGGAVSVNRSSASFSRCDFVENSVGLAGFGDVNYGGALADASFGGPAGSAAYDRCRFLNNRCEEFAGGGGALFTIFSGATFSNSLFLANSTDGPGGAMALDNVADVRFNNVTVAGNVSGSGAGGVHEFSEVADSYAFNNSIVWGNASPETFPFNPNMFSFSGNFAISDSIIQFADTLPIAAYLFERVVVADPNFASTTGPDGALWSGDENLRPVSPSPAVDRGNNLFATGVADLDSIDRRQDHAPTPDTGVGTAPLVDIGAYELPRCVADVNNDTLATPADFTAWLGAFNAETDPNRPRADVNRDGGLSPSDLTAWLAAFADGCP